MTEERKFESVLDQMEAHMAEKPFRDAMSEAGRELKEQDAEIKRLREMNAEMLAALVMCMEAFDAAIGDDELIKRASDASYAAIAKAEPSE